MAALALSPSGISSSYKEFNCLWSVAMEKGGYQLIGKTPFVTWSPSAASGICVVVKISLSKWQASLKAVYINIIWFEVIRYLDKDGNTKFGLIREISN